MYVQDSKIYEYKIKVSALKNFKYYLTETPEKTKLLYDTTISDKEYEILLRKAVLENNYEGTDTKSILALINKFKGKTRKMFENVPKLPNYEEIKTKYAPTVTHFMIYFSVGIVEYESVALKHFGHNSNKSKILDW